MSSTSTRQPVRNYLELSIQPFLAILIALENFIKLFLQPRTMIGRWDRKRGLGSLLYMPRKDESFLLKYLDKKTISPIAIHKGWTSLG